MTDDASVAAHCICIGASLTEGWTCNLRMPGSFHPYSGFLRTVSGGRVTGAAFGVGGQTCPEIRDRYHRDAIGDVISAAVAEASAAPTPRRVFAVVLGGTNDMAAGTDAGAMATSFGALRSIVDDAKRRGATPVLLSIPPLGLRLVGLTEAVAARSRWNTALEEMAAAAGAGFVDLDLHVGAVLGQEYLRERWALETVPPDVMALAFPLQPPGGNAPLSSAERPALTDAAAMSADARRAQLRPLLDDDALEPSARARLLAVMDATGWAPTRPMTAYTAEADGDGLHCSAAGYGAVAQAVAEHVLHVANQHSSS